MIRVLSFILTLIGFALGYGVYHYASYHPKLDSDLNLVDILTLLTTVFIAFYIPTALERSLSNKRFERELLIKKLESIREHFNAIDKIFYHSYSNNSITPEAEIALVEQFKYISVELSVLISLANRICNNKTQKKIKNIIILRRSYKSIITGGQFQSIGFRYTVTDKIRSEKAIKIIDSELSHLVLDVNTC